MSNEGCPGAVFWVPKSLFWPTFDGGVGLFRFPVDEHVLELALGIQLVQGADGAVIQRHGTHPARLAVGGWDAPDPPLDIDMPPCCLQGLIEPCPVLSRNRMMLHIVRLLSVFNRIAVFIAHN
jgi:hypothetical protein